MKKLLLIFLLILTLSSCGTKEEPQYVDGVLVVNNHTKFNILENTRYETTIHTFSSNIEGPRILIIGGINGHELAGWHTALKYSQKENYFQGTVMIIPKANILATKLEQSYPGRTNNGIFDGVQYSDLNMAFPGKNTDIITEKLAFEITKVIKEFNPEYIIDLQEDYHSYTSAKIGTGDTIVCGNEYTLSFAYQVVDNYNLNHKLDNEAQFKIGEIQEGSFNDYFGKLYLNVNVITIITNGELRLKKRVEQQTNMIEVIFDIVWK